MRLKQHRQSGLTLIECMVSIVILGVGLIGIAGALNMALLADQKASDTQLATAIAQATIEEMRSLGFGSVVYDVFPASATSTTVPDLQELHGGRRSIVIEDTYQGDPRLKSVLVTVSWRGRNGSSAGVTLETVITNRGGHAGT